jgi:hypothetical protein
MMIANIDVQLHAVSKRASNDPPSNYSAASDQHGCGACRPGAIVVLADAVLDFFLAGVAR